VKDEAERERLWEERHEIAADSVYSMCTELGGFFLKVIISCNFECRLSLPARHLQVTRLSWRWFLFLIWGFGFGNGNQRHGYKKTNHKLVPWVGTDLQIILTTVALITIIGHNANANGIFYL